MVARISCLRSFTFWILMLALTCPTTLALAQVPGISMDVNNFVHPDGTKTGPLGRLGHVEKRGHGPVPMVFVPGAAFGWSVFDGFMTRNADRYTMYAVTPPGYDGTPPPPLPTSTDFTKRDWSDALCASIVELIDKERLDRPVLLGHHMMGDYYALRVAIEHPKKTRGVISVAGPLMQVFPSPSNGPGKPVKLADMTERRKSVDTMWAPFYKHVTKDMWVSGSYSAATFCKDEARAKQLFEQQIAVPIPTQVRYFLEYQTDDLSRRVRDLKVPVLSVQAKTSMTLKESIEQSAAMNIKFYGSLEAAETAWTQQLTKAWGSVDAGLRWMRDIAYRWEHVRLSIPDFELEYLEDTRTFIMEDQPEKLDRIIAAFVERLD